MQAPRSRIRRYLRSQGLAGPDNGLAAAVAATCVEGLPDAWAAVQTVVAPLPAVGGRFEGRLSPRLLYVLARALDCRPGDDVLLAGDPMVSLAAALLRLPKSHRPGSVTLASGRPKRAGLTAALAGVATTNDPSHHAGDVVRILTLRDDPARTFDRALLLGIPKAAAVKLRLADESNCVRIETTGRRPRLVQAIRASGTEVEVDLTEHRVRPDDAADMDTDAVKERNRRRSRTKRIGNMTIGRLILLERLHVDVWRGRTTSRLQQEIRDVIEDTFDPILRGDGGTGSAVSRDHRLARTLFHLGYLEQMAGDVRTAAALYRNSIDILESAEAWTFYAWAISAQGRLADAIDACRQAIRIDPDFGNPYNDIGAYLIELDEPEAAKRWLHRATVARRYAAPYFPFLNLARIFLGEGDLVQARDAAERALEVAPDYPPAERLLREIEARESNEATGR